jgi:MFS family permease
MGLLTLTRPQQNARPRETSTLKSLAAGASFIWRTKVILAAITLDMFAVLFGGATALLPVYAKDILHVGPDGYGWLRAAPSMGAIIMAMIIAHRKPFQQAGRALLMAVAGFGVATIVFGFSTSFALSMLMLATLGGLDMVSVVVRRALILIRTPDEMRGRISAVNGIFISSSNELGTFESGFTAQLFGPVLSVVGGGIAAILVVIGIAWVWPELRNLKTLSSE